MNKVKMMICLSVFALALTACDKEDNPVEPTVVNVDDPQEEVTNQPAYAPGASQTPGE